MARGSIQKRTSTAGVVSYRVVYDLPELVAGVRRQKTETVRTRKAAEALLRQRLQEVEQGSYIAPSTETVAAYLTRWLTSVAASTRAATAHQQEGVVTRRIVPHLGQHRLDRLTPLHVQAWLGDLAAAGYAASTIRVSHAILHHALADAVRWRLISHNPAAGVSLPLIPRKAIPTWTPEEVQGFLAATAASPFAPLWYLLLDSGMRIGEALALTWADLDLEQGWVTVRRTLTRSRDGATIMGDDTKTRSGRRTIPLTPATVARLRQHRHQQRERRLALAPPWHDLDIVFDRGDGRWWSPGGVYRYFKRDLQVSGCPPISLHGLRHTSLTLLMGAGIHPKVAQERAGHSSAILTMDLYSHVTPTMQQTATDALARVLSGTD